MSLEVRRPVLVSVMWRMRQLWTADPAWKLELFFVFFVFLGKLELVGTWILQAIARENCFGPSCPVLNVLPPFLNTSLFRDFNK